MFSESLEDASLLRALLVRGDLLGVTSLVRAPKLNPRRYERLLGCFHSEAIKLDTLC